MKKGFTLIELLAVIVIIAVIALVTIPLIGRVIENSKKGALTASASGIIEAAEIYYSTKMMENPETKTFMCSSEGCLSGEEKLAYKGQVSEGRVILYADGKVSICIEDGTNASLKLAEQSEITTEEGSCNYDSEDYSIDATVSKTKYNELQEELNNGKKVIANAITNKGVTTSETATFEEMATNIEQIQGSSEVDRQALYESLQYSGLVTEDMTVDEILSALSTEYPEIDKTSWLGLKRIVNSGRAAEILSVGDQITAYINGKEEVFDIVHIDYRTALYGNNIIIAKHNCLDTTMRMQNTNTTAGGYEATLIAEYLNGEYYESLPEDMRSVITEMTFDIAKGNASSELQSETHKIWLPLEYNIFGATYQAASTEHTTGGAEQFEYFKTASNRNKTLGDGVTACAWWESSPTASYTTDFCYVNQGGATISYASNAVGVLPFFMIAAD